MKKGILFWLSVLFIIVSVSLYFIWENVFGSAFSFSDITTIWIIILVCAVLYVIITLVSSVFNLSLIRGFIFDGLDEEDEEFEEFEPSDGEERYFDKLKSFLVDTDEDQDIENTADLTEAGVPDALNEIELEDVRYNYVLGTNNMTDLFSSGYSGGRRRARVGRNDDVLKLMADNMSEIRGYFSLSKKHAGYSFALALCSCVFGMILLAFAVIIMLSLGKVEPAIVAAVGGAIAELFAATALVVHNRSLSQLNHYYRSLHNNERFLSVVNLVSKLPKSKRDDVYMEIIRAELKMREKSEDSAHQS